MAENNYRVIFTPKAVTDLDEVYIYISSELFAEDAAHNLLERIETSIMRLSKFPFSGTLVADEFLRGKGYRKLIIENYVAFYLVNKAQNKVVIMRILYGRRKYQNLL